MENLKTVAKYILIPFTALLGVIYYLLTKVNSLESVIARKDAEKKIAQTMDRLEEVKQDADNKETEFDSKYSDYIRARNDDSKS